MSKTKIHEITVDYQPSTGELIPVQVERSLGRVAISDEKEARRENYRRTHKAQDHGDAAEQAGHDKELDGWEVRGAKRLNDFVIKEANDESAQEDFDAWELELGRETPSIQYSSESDLEDKRVSVSLEHRKYESVMSDLEKIGLTPKKLAEMSDAEKEALKQWLHKRARKA